jgi:hypothetical protein
MCLLFFALTLTFEGILREQNLVRNSACIPGMEIGVAAALPPEQLFPADPLRIFPIVNLQPTRLILWIYDLLRRGQPDERLCGIMGQFS